MKRITIQDHLSLEDIQQRERQADTVIERLHWQTIRLIGQGKQTVEVAEREAQTNYRTESVNNSSTDKRSASHSQTHLDQPLSGD